MRNGSAVLEDESRRITVTTHLRPHLRESGTAADAPLLEVHPPKRRRLRQKTAVDEDGVAIRAMKTRDGERRGLEKELLKMIQEQMEESVKRPQLKHHEAMQGDEGYVTLGAYQHGGIVGVTNCTKDNPEFASKAAELMALVFPDEVFTSITVVKDVKMPIHRDSYNDNATVAPVRT